MAELSSATRPEQPVGRVCVRCQHADLRRKQRSARRQKRRAQLALRLHRLRHAGHPGSRSRTAIGRGLKTITGWTIQAIILAVVALIIAHCVHF
jgi:hypothetical protein